MRSRQYAADIAACRNGQQGSGKIPPAQMETRNPNSPSPSKGCQDTGSPSSKTARAEWLLARLIHRIAFWIRARPLDGGDDDEDADAGTDAVGDNPSTTKAPGSARSEPLVESIAT